jgi:hypothetical protein
MIVHTERRDAQNTNLDPQGASSLTSPSSFASFVSPLVRISASEGGSTCGAGNVPLTLLAPRVPTDAEAVDELALESRRFDAPWADRVVRRSGRLSSCSAAGSGVGVTSGKGTIESLGEASSGNKLLPPRGFLVRFAGYVASPSSTSLRFRFAPAPPPPRLLRGLAFSLISRAATAAIALTLDITGRLGGSSSSASRNFAAGRRERAERRPESESSMLIGVEWPKYDGSRGGKESASRPGYELERYIKERLEPTEGVVQREGRRHWVLFAGGCVGANNDARACTLCWGRFGRGIGCRCRRGRELVRQR